MNRDDLPLLDSAHAATLEIRWVADEAQALMRAPFDAERRDRFMARKRALLAYLEKDEGGHPERTTTCHPSDQRTDTATATTGPSSPA